MKRGAIFLDSFSGAASDLRKGDRTEENVLAALRRDPRISTWDFGEHAWLRGLIADMKRAGMIAELPEPYPWHRFKVIEAAPAPTPKEPTP